jgi:arginyl-tRNA synthetase
LDLFRTAIAKRVSDAIPQLTLEKAYTGVDYGKKGVDFTVALPRFRLTGKAEELAKQVVDSVRLTGSRLRIANLSQGMLVQT